MADEKQAIKDIALSILQNKKVQIAVGGVLIALISGLLGMKTTELQSIICPASVVETQAAP